MARGLSDVVLGVAIFTFVIVIGFFGLPVAAGVVPGAILAGGLILMGLAAAWFIIRPRL